MTLIFGTTSYVLPDDYLPNLRLLAPLVDDVELMFFEGANLPSSKDFEKMAELCTGDDFGVTVHLPVDADLSHPRPDERKPAVEACLRAIDLTRPLSPRAYVLHPASSSAEASLVREFPGARLEALAESLGALTEVTERSRLAVENLMFPFEWVWPVVDELGLSTVLDVGHLELAGGRPEDYLERYAHRLAVVHLHGVSGGRDHLDPVVWGDLRLRQLLEMLRAVGAKRTGRPLVVTLEVFGGRVTAGSLRSVAKALLSEGPYEAPAAAALTTQSKRLLSAAEAIEKALPPPAERRRRPRGGGRGGGRARPG